MPDSPARAAIDASIIIPTYDERENIALAIEAVRRAMTGRGSYEILVVDDDSPSRTWEVVEKLRAEDPRIRLFRRVDRRGLSSAIVDGLNMAEGQGLCVVDADLQHDIVKVPELLDALRDHDLAIGTRYANEGSTGTWSRWRRLPSRLATRACQSLLNIRASDPMSGFFAIRKESFARIAGRLNPRGYKILMEILFHHGPEQVAEVPYVFTPRRLGESKLRSGVVVDYGLSLLELASGHVFNARFVKYCAVGLLGVLVQLAVLSALEGRLDDAIALGVAIACAVVSNYVLNNAWTFRDRRHRSWRERLRGLLVFSMVAAGGAIINDAVSFQLHLHTGWDLRLTSLAGIALATLWNYEFNRGLTWQGWERQE